MESKPLVLVTGVTGYIAAWVAYRVLETEEYRVRATMRNPTDEAKLDTLKEGFGKHFDDLELVKGDLLDRDSIFEAVDGCTHVLHVASPFPLESPKDENDIIRPAVEGTQNVLDACKKFGVKRLVITSSCAAINDGTLDGQEIDEETWSVESGKLKSQ